ncbi:cell division protein ZapA [Alkalicoccus halolimnae]|uniref:Cell division protein ZapA n=1 Tax=Alkalicoccus halolimnae TaxID=1667239 RepID=A0A5C7F538_9BACI|nr:cell division protein ZapA [Alkalicoccus halolimnae]TXF85771.1 cell division protein ZapA [Alkalicoccus halolimnae]
MSREGRKIRTVVTIAKNTYTVVGEDSERHVHEAAELVDKNIREIKSRNPYLSSSQLAVLAALNISNDYLTLQKKVQEEKNQKEE